MTRSGRKTAIQPSLNGNLRRGPVCYWAENGNVRWRDTNDGSTGSMSPQEAAVRAHAVVQMMSRSGEDGHYPSEMALQASFLDQMAQVIHEARVQQADLRKR